MPVIIVGADSTLGPAIIEALATRDGEIRAFVSDVEVLDELRAYVEGSESEFGHFEPGFKYVLSHDKQRGSIYTVAAQLGGEAGAGVA